MTVIRDELDKLYRKLAMASNPWEVQSIQSKINALHEQEVIEPGTT
jgi:hypothetical protein